MSGKWKENLHYLERTCHEFKQLWQVRWGSSVSYPFYLHVLADHVVEIMNRYGSLVVFSSEVLERIHSGNVFTWNRSTSNGGGKQRKHTISKDSSLFANHVNNLPASSTLLCIEDIFLK